MPDLLHVIPVGDDAVLDRVFCTKSDLSSVRIVNSLKGSRKRHKRRTIRTLEGEDAAFALSFVSDVRVFLTHPDHHALVARSTDDGREDLKSVAYWRGGSILDRE